MPRRQAFLPVVSYGTRVFGFIPLATPVELEGDETEVVVGGNTLELKWIDVPKKGFRGGFKLATVPMDESDLRRGNQPPGFHLNPDVYFYPVYQERDVIHWGPLNTAPFWWVFTYGELISPQPTDPPPPDEEEPEVTMWTIEAAFASVADCSYIDLDWIQFAPLGLEAVSLSVDGPLPGWLKAMFVSGDMSANTAGLSQAQSSPTLRLFRSGAAPAGTYPIPMTITVKGGDAYSFVLELNAI